MSVLQKEAVTTSQTKKQIILDHISDSDTRAHVDNFDSKQTFIPFRTSFTFVLHPHLNVFVYSC